MTGLGAAVTGAVACSWFGLWGEARQHGDTSAAQEAVEAMTIEKDWPILNELDQTGDWPGFVVRHAQSMADGHYHGHSTLAAVGTGLGCDRYWVRVAKKAAS
jgi:hypothetical protein